MNGYGSAFAPLERRSTAEGSLPGSGEGPVYLDTERCLALRSRYSDCRRCEAICPAGVLQVRDERIELAEGCLRCGRCSAVCPTGALRVEGFDSIAPAPAVNDTPVYVDCWKVASSQSPPGALRLPCLGGIALHDLVRWHVDSGRRPIVLLDRGWCGQCSAGSTSSHPVAETLAAARRLMAELGVEEGALPRLESKPMPASGMPATIPDPLAARPVSRREFFAGMTRSAVRAVNAVRGRAARNPGSAPRRTWHTLSDGTPRSRLISAALALGARNGRSIPAGLFPAIRVSDACRDHRICAAICPTGALQVYEDDGITGIRFDADACIACGDCTRACPERALTLVPRRDDAPAHTPAVLTRWTRRTCARCDDEFASGGDENHCPACRKDLDLFSNRFSIGSQHT